jgi:hypothetical protein
MTDPEFFSIAGDDDCQVDSIYLRRIKSKFVRDKIIWPDTINYDSLGYVRYSLPIRIR